MGELSEALKVPSEFRLINGADPVIVGLGDDEGDSMKFLREVLSENPAGPTPLCTHITAVVKSIASIERELRANNQKAVVVIATDGESSDGNVAEALRPLTEVSTFSQSLSCLLNIFICFSSSCRCWSLCGYVPKSLKLLSIGTILITSSNWI